ncbi:hypothetical protein FPQ18DRAFT_337551 [Pyronema domesticum]|uniref:PPPDE domain-containing protein n=1 Tax=Pyronema omphalodes (strain CBS 100304) TaxID=1076935 RepID=U4LBP5_PYROM|nr:hypothetical protein FPQ18DRAFT_337551 [Pyronema domesticum]CCX07722.1 Protein of unknown function [Pyronema omphalodes CBS 100304]
MLSERPRRSYSRPYLPDNVPESVLTRGTTKPRTVYVYCKPLPILGSLKVRPILKGVASFKSERSGKVYMPLATRITQKLEHWSLGVHSSDGSCTTLFELDQSLKKSEAHAKYIVSHDELRSKAYQPWATNPSGGTITTLSDQQIGALAQYIIIDNPKYNLIVNNCQTHAVLLLYGVSDNPDSTLIEKAREKAEWRTSVAP